MIPHYIVYLLHISKRYLLVFLKSLSEKSLELLYAIIVMTFCYIIEQFTVNGVLKKLLPDLKAVI